MVFKNCTFASVEQQWESCSVVSADFFKISSSSWCSSPQHLFLSFHAGQSIDNHLVLLSIVAGNIWNSRHGDELLYDTLMLFWSLLFQNYIDPIRLSSLPSKFIYFPLLISFTLGQNQKCKSIHYITYLWGGGRVIKLPNRYICWIDCLVCWTLLPSLESDVVYTH